MNGCLQIKSIIGCIVFALCLASHVAKGQLFVPADTFRQGRAIAITGTGLAVYSGGMYLLGKAWYKDNLTNSFKFFNDNGEWLQMDKVGHVFSAYNEAGFVHDLYRSAGVRERKALWLGIGAGLLAQTSIEIFDGFSDRWGFSWGDVAGNFAGLALFGFQQAAWHEQKLKLKVSSDFRSYSTSDILPLSGSESDNLHRRAGELFSNNLAGRLLKDYNAQTYWLSFSPADFSSQRFWPAWLDISIGYSGENLFGGYGNTWDYQGNTYQLSGRDFPRYRQFLLSLDLDLTRIPCRSAFLRDVFRVLNIIKIPAPTLELNSLGKLKGHWIYF